MQNSAYLDEAGVRSKRVLMSIIADTKQPGQCSFVELEPNDTKLKRMRFIIFMMLLWRSPTNVQGQVNVTTVRNMGTQKRIASWQQFECGNYMVYSVVKLPMKPKSKPASDQARNVILAPVSYHQMAQSITKQVSYADAVKNNSEAKKNLALTNTLINTDLA
ncbi:hypothetical protein EVAR_70725_1 [Eumeta japonica]|uniref:Uncharacterized protein n=1 Tax=Eumeta variegata TaxID=151549 RepID=A0A4C1T726_EUMVA|nr:hypothetical protein EVAR_70725_1 [Eumeta japonica]